MSSFVAGARLGWSRIKGRTTGFFVLCGVVCTALVALIERNSEPYYASDRTLIGGAFGLILPLAGYLLVERATLGRRLDQSLDELARHGADRRGLGLGLAATTAAALAAFSLLIAVLAVGLSRGTKDPLLGRDLLSTLWIAVLAGTVYAAWFSLASLFGKRGHRGVAWLGDFLLGSGASAMAAPFPRGHVRNLLGGQPVLDLAQLTSAVVLVTLTLLYLSIAAARTPP